MSSAIEMNSAITAEIARLHHEQLRKSWNESGVIFSIAVLKLPSTTEQYNEHSL